MNTIAAIETGDTGIHPDSNDFPIDVSIIVVSYNTRELTLECLHSIFRETSGAAYEVIVVDNASSDGTAAAIADEFPQVRLLALEQNMGFARANNLAAEYAGGRYLLLLNPDTLILDNAVESLLSFAEQHPEAGIFGGCTLYPDGSLNPTSCWDRPTPWSVLCQAVGLSAIFRGSRLFDPESIGHWGRDSIREVDIVTGCFLLLPRELWMKLEGFDPAFFIYGEEADLCLRAAAIGTHCVIYPHARIVHYGGASETSSSAKKIRLLRAKAQLFQRHWSPFWARLGPWMLDLRVLTRMAGYRIAAAFSAVARAKSRVWSDAWRQRRQWHAHLGLIL